MSVVLSEKILNALTGLGIDTKRTRRVVIDLQVGEPPIVHVEAYGDTRLIDVARALEGVEIRRLDASESEAT